MLLAYVKCLSYLLIFIDMTDLITILNIVLLDIKTNIEKLHKGNHKHLKMKRV